MTRARRNMFDFRGVCAACVYAMQTQSDLLLNFDDDVDTKLGDPRQLVMQRSKEKMRDKQICRLMEYEDFEDEAGANEFLHFMGPAAARVNLRYDIKRRVPNFEELPPENVFAKISAANTTLRRALGGISATDR